MQKFKPKSVLENNGDCGDKQLRGGWSLHEIIKLNHLPASLPERTRREKSARDWLQKLPEKAPEFHWIRVWSNLYPKALMKITDQSANNYEN